MYSVVGCGECHALWVVDGRPETTQCPRCRKRYQFGKLKRFAETETSDEAAHVRSAMLAKRADDGEFVAAEEIDVDAVGMDDETFLAASGVDADAVSDAAERAEGGTGESRSRKQVVLDAIAEVEEPTADAIRSYAVEAGVPGSYVDGALERLARAGEVTVSDGVYRRL